MVSVPSSVKSQVIISPIVPLSLILSADSLVKEPSSNVFSSKYTVLFSCSFADACILPGTVNINIAVKSSRILFFITFLLHPILCFTHCTAWSSTVAILIIFYICSLSLSFIFCKKSIICSSSITYTSSISFHLNPTPFSTIPL